MLGLQLVALKKKSVFWNASDSFLEGGGEEIPLIYIIFRYNQGRAILLATPIGAQGWADVRLPGRRARLSDSGAECSAVRLMR